MPAAFREYVRMVTVAIGLLVLFAIAALVIQGTDATAEVQPIQASPVAVDGQDLLVDSDWLVAQLNDSEPDPVIIDAGDPDQYAREHIPGAIHLWWQDTMNLNGAGYGEAFSLSAKTPFTPNFGATMDDVIVVYDNASSEHASRVVWQLRTSGYPHAVVLDGGLAGWKGIGQPVSDTEALAADVGAPEEIWIAENEVTTAELAGQIGDPGMVIIDTRSADQKQDTINDTIRVGQIPGAVSLPAGSVIGDDGTFLSPEELEEIFQPLDLSPEDEIVVYGRFGTETGQVWLALHLAGHDNVRVYDDSWLAWGFDETLPIEPIVP